MKNKRYSKKEYPLRQHGGIHISAILAIGSFVATFLLALGFYIYLSDYLSNGRNLADTVILGCAFVLFFSGLSACVVYIILNLRLQLAANNKVIVLRHNKKYLEFDISNIKGITLIYRHHMMESNSKNSDKKYDEFSKYGKIGISFVDGSFYAAKGHNLDYAAYLLEQYTQIKAHKIKIPHKNDFKDFIQK